MQNIIDSLLKKYPNIKVGLISFGSKVEAKGDCLSNSITILPENLSKEEKIKEMGLNNKNIINSPIKETYSKIKTTLESISTEGCTALGPAVLLSLHLLDGAKKGSRIFLCTDGESNEGVGALHSLCFK